MRFLLVLSLLSLPFFQVAEAKKKEKSPEINEMIKPAKPEKPKAFQRLGAWGGFFGGAIAATYFGVGLAGSELGEAYSNLGYTAVLVAPFTGKVGGQVGRVVDGTAGAVTGSAKACYRLFTRSKN